MSELNGCLKTLYENYAVVFPPIEPKTAQQASVKLVKSGVPPIPLDYVSFLAATNGLSWNGVVLFSLENIERNKGQFFHPGIMQNFSFCQNNAVMRKKLLLGLGWETILAYDFLEKEYVLLDRYSYEPIMKFSTLVDFLKHVIKPLQKQLPEGMGEGQG
ncbi:MAG: YrhA family protein [Alphaproteobacteria bacterium]|nr:YrhA family protein [Alphaproteobacteria bacterium]